MVFHQATVARICTNPDKVVSRGIWLGTNPLRYSTPLLLVQLTIISLTSMLIDLCLQPLGQSTIVSQIFGGIVFGPSFLGHMEVVASHLFPMRSNMVIENAAAFGLMFFFFQIGVKMDLSMVWRPDRLATFLSLSMTALSLALPVLFSVLLKAFFSMDDSLSSSLPFIAVAQSLTSFPNIAWLLHELRLLNSDLGRIAISSAMICDGIGLLLVIIIFVILETTDVLTGFLAVGTTLALFIAILYGFRPVAMWVQSRVSERKGVGEGYTSLIFVSVLVAGFVSEIIGQHYILGPLLLGLVVPDGPPLGAALVAKIDCLVSGLFYPTFLTVSGLKTNVFKVRARSAGIVFLVVIIGAMVKIGAVLGIGQCAGMPLRDAFVLGLLMNAKGIYELVIYNFWRNHGVLGDQEFTLLVLSTLLVTAIIFPLIRLLHDPYNRRLPIRRRTLQHAKRGSELRVLVCIHDQENVPTLVNILEASWANEESPIAVITLLLVELVGRSAPILIPHRQLSMESCASTDSRSGHIINAFHQYELHHGGCVSVQSFSAVSYMDTMHDDVTRVALDQNVSLVIMPYHKTWAIDGEIGSVNRNIQHLNVEVLKQAPCSVGILVDRGILNGSLSIINNQSSYNVAILYIGGHDDVESLCYGARMANHRNVTLTVIHFLLFGADNARERKLDMDLIYHVCRANSANEAFLYREEVVRDGVELAASIRELQNRFDLIIVGRHHQDSALLHGLTAWSECAELGVIGDLLASPDFQGSASVLVMQQQRMLGGRLLSRATKPVITDRDVPHHQVHSRRAEGGNGGAWAITVDRG